MAKSYITLFTLVSCILKLVDFQIIPPNPCPNIFRYQHTDGVVHGRVEFENDGSGVYALSVNMSVAVFVSNDKNIRLHLLTSPNDVANGAPLVYNVYFPMENAIPKPTKIVFNNAIYCASPPATLRPGGYVTNLWADTYLKITVTYTEAPNFNRPIAPFTTPRPFINYDECGVSNVKVQSLIANGDEVLPGEFPWLTAIMYKVNGEFKYRCTGTLISKRHVITAGHCLQYGKVPLFSKDEVIVVLGTMSLENWRSEGVLSGVESFETHADFKGTSADVDFAVITLDTEMKFRENIRRACLWEESDDLDVIVGLEGAVAGWGSVNPDEEYTKDARSINLPVVSQAVCLRSDSGFKAITSSRTFCAGSVNGKGTCAGDSGAGFLMLRAGRWALRGVTSLALKENVNCDLDNYSVFADVAKVKSWIRSMLT